jgi:predicted  nucleic acid-binding Zn-ribbon protein
MNDTPRTDAAAVSKEYIAREMDIYSHKFVLSDHMRDVERELAAAIASIDEERERAQREGERVIAARAQRDRAVRDANRYAYAKKHFDELYQSPIWTNDGNPDYRIDSDKFDAAIDAGIKECNDPLELIPNSSKNYGDEMSNQIKEMQEFIAENRRLIEDHDLANTQRELAAALAQRDKALSRYTYVKKHFDEIYQSTAPIRLAMNLLDQRISKLEEVCGHLFTDYQINSDKFDDAIDAGMKECGK